MKPWLILRLTTWLAKQVEDICGSLCFGLCRWSAVRLAPNKLSDADYPNRGGNHWFYLCCVGSASWGTHWHKKQKNRGDFFGGVSLSGFVMEVSWPNVCIRENECACGCVCVCELSAVQLCICLSRSTFSGMTHEGAHHASETCRSVCVCVCLV